MRLALFSLLSLIGTSQALELPAVSPSQGTIHRWVSLPASFEAWQKAALHTKVTGYVAEIHVDKGDSVKQGQILATLEVPELEADLIEVRAQIKAAEIQVKRLHEARAKSPELVLPQDVDDAEAKLAIAEAKLARGEALLKFATLRAPFDGVVTARHVDRGALASVQGGPLLELADISTLRLQIHVTELETGLAKPGRPVKAQVDALGTASPALDGSISRISYSLSPSTRTMLVEADFKNPDQKLRPGMYVMSKLALETHDKATLIPVTALVMEKTNAFVFKHQDGKALKTQVKIGFNDGTHVEVPELKPEDRLLVPGTVILTDKQPVDVKKD